MDIDWTDPAMPPALMKCRVTMYRLPPGIISYIYIQVNKKFCELKGGNIGIVEKAQETRFGMSPKYSRYIGIAS